MVCDERPTEIALGLLHATNLVSSKQQRLCSMIVKWLCARLVGWLVGWAILDCCESQVYTWVESKPHADAEHMNGWSFLSASFNCSISSLVFMHIQKLSADINQIGYSFSGISSSSSSSNNKQLLCQVYGRFLLV